MPTIDLCASVRGANRDARPALLIGCSDLPRCDAKLIDVPRADDHLNAGACLVVRIALLTSLDCTLNALETGEPLRTLL